LSGERITATEVHFEDTISLMTQLYRTPSQAGITRLYHYEKFCPQWLSATLSDQKIHCSNPANLNDPWDCRPSFDAGGIGKLTNLSILT
jgi:hypothetical protein